MDKDDKMDKKIIAITGTPGAGKTYLYLNLLLQLLRQRLGKFVFIVLDFKSELCDLLQKIYLPALLWELDPKQRQQVLDDFAVIDPFSKHSLPPFQILKEIPGVGAEPGGAAGGVHLALRDHAGQPVDPDLPGTADAASLLRGGRRRRRPGRAAPGADGAPRARLRG